MIKIVSFILYAVALLMLAATVYYGKKVDIRKVLKEYKAIMNGAYEDRGTTRKQEYNIYVKGVPLKKKKKIISDEEREIFKRVEQQKAAQRKVETPKKEIETQEPVNKPEQETQSKKTAPLTVPEKEKHKTELLKAEPAETQDPGQPGIYLPERTEMLKHPLDKTEVLGQQSQNQKKSTCKKEKGFTEILSEK